MKRFLKKLSAVAIAAVMVVSLSIGLFAGCSKSYDLSVYIFAGEADQVTNRQLIRAWEQQYAEKLKAEDPEKFGDDFTISVDDTYQSATEVYFDTLEREIAAGSASDVFYVSPKYVKSYAVSEAVLDLTDYVDWNEYDPNGLWSAALGAYAYDQENDSIGDAVTYQESGADGAGFYTEADDKAGLYALPKDFSSFGLAYNRNFFSDELKAAYTGTTDENGAVYYVNADGTQGAAASIVNIGRTVRYYPFNFYQYESYSDALAAGDPIADAANSVGGYDVTILGWPGQTYETGDPDNEETSYDESIGYYTYTYAEYSAMAWAVCYYAERYDITNRTTRTHELMTWLDDANRPTDSQLGTTNYVYGNDQYEGTLYLTAWLLGNDVDIISDDYTSVTAPSADADYGINSDKYKEAYAAFLAFGSDWNANSYFSGSPESTQTRGGWPTFNAGRTVFYGIGTWDLSTFNSAVQSVLDVGIMPEPVSESYSPYARVKDADYEEAEYGTDPVATAMTEEQCEAEQEDRQDVWAARLDTVGYGVNADVLDRYTGEDSWKVEAMADLCAYLAMDPTMQQALTYSGSQLTTFVDQGVDYLYYQAEGYEDGSFNYMITPDGNATGTLTVTEAEVNDLKTTRPSSNEPTYLDESFTTSTTLTGEDIWTFATAVATKMYRTHQSASGTVKNYIDTNFPSLSAYVNTYFQDSSMSICSTKAYAYKCLNLVALRYNDRNLQIRMVSGANGALDSCLYTYNADWINDIGTQKGKFLIAWEATRSAGGWKYNNFGQAIPTTIDVTNYTLPTPGSDPKADGSGWSGGKFYTPSAFCDWQVIRSQNLLNQAIEEEQQNLG